MPRYKASEAREAAKATKKAAYVAPTGKGGSSQELRGFVKYPKNAEIKAEFMGYVSRSEGVYQDSATLYQDGFKVSTQWDEDSDCIRLTAFSNDAGRSDCGLAISVWAQDFYEGHALLSFFVYGKGMGSLGSDFFTPPDAKVKRTFWD